MLHLLRRKLHTIALTIKKCANWPAIMLAKLGLARDPVLLRFRDGFVLKPMSPLRGTWGEIFEPSIADLYRIADADPDLIVDVGGNIGAFTCRAAFLHPRAKVHAFEPSAKHAALLEENVRLNNLTNVTIHRAPVTKDGREVLFAALGTGGGSGIFLHEGATPIPLRSVTLQEVSYKDSRSLFVKLDCEGAEGELIEWIGANRAQLPSRVQIACELHHWCPMPHEQILAHLDSGGFVAEEKILFDEAYLYASSEGRSAGIVANTFTSSDQTV